MAVYELQRDFQTEVLDRSRKRPVLVDFWAAWCGPCKILGPVLEKLAKEPGSRFDLVKVDTDAHQDVASIFEIRSIPTVILFDQGQPVNGFMGALPEAQVRQWLDQTLPPGAGTAPEEEEAGEEAEGDPIAAAARASAAGLDDEARRILIKALAADPEDGRVRVALARLRFPAETEAVRELVEPVPEEDEARDAAVGMRRLADLADWGRGQAPPSFHPQGSPGPLERYRQGGLALAEGRYRDALDAFLEVTATDRTLDGDGGRKAAVAVFDLLGEDDPLTREYRRKLALILF